MLPCKLQTRLVGIALRGARALAPCHGLSGGERLKLGLLMVLAQLPDLLLLMSRTTIWITPRASCLFRCWPTTRGLCC